MTLEGSIRLAIACLSLVGASAQAQNGAASGEVLLQISATGSARNAPDSVIINVQIMTTGDTAVAARAAGVAKTEALIRALTANGVDKAAISQVRTSASAFGFIGNEAAGVDYPQRLNPGSEPRLAQSIVRIKLRSLSQIGQVREVLDSQNLTMAGIPFLALGDEREARRAAIADAVLKARQDAETYASVAGFRVLRIVRISNQSARLDTLESYSDLIRGMGSLQAADPDTVTTSASVTIDFMIGPN